jgi:DhnA family fructose-bisphosphate aldolase class Ia
LDKDGEMAVDIASYAAQIAALLGAHIIKVKLPTDHLSLPEAKKMSKELVARKKAEAAAKAKSAPGKKGAKAAAAKK